MNHYTAHIHEKQDGFRLDIALSQNIAEYSRNKIQFYIKKGCVELNALIVNPATSTSTSTSTSTDMQLNKNTVITDINHRVKFGEVYTLLINNSTSVSKKIKSLNKKLDVLYEDDDLLVINKPYGLTVHPGAGNVDNTLVNILVSYLGENNLSNVGEGSRRGIVHRLDKNTSGVMVIAKNNFTHVSLGEQFAKHTITRNYRALIFGVIYPLQGVIDNIIARSYSNRTKMSVTSDKMMFMSTTGSEIYKNSVIKKSRGKRAITHYKVINVSSSKTFSLVDCELHTGRTHQIRVHLSNKGHPLVGDDVYKGKLSGKVGRFFPEDITMYINSLKRQALHAYNLGFIHPRTKELMTFNQKEDSDLSYLYDEIFQNHNMSDEVKNNTPWK